MNICQYAQGDMLFYRQVPSAGLVQLMEQLVPVGSLGKPLLEKETFQPVLMHP